MSLLKLKGKLYKAASSWLCSRDQYVSQKRRSMRESRKLCNEDATMDK